MGRQPSFGSRERDGVVVLARLGAREDAEAAGRVVIRGQAPGPLVSERVRLLPGATRRMRDSPELWLM